MALPELFGAYLLHQPIAIGSTSEVYLGQTTGEFPRLCAIKRIRPQLYSIEEFNKRFIEDAQLLVRLIHGNIVTILEVGQVDDRPFIAMEYIDGINIQQLLDPHNPIPPDAAIYIALQTIEALAYVERQRGDHKKNADQAWPHEIMISRDGVVKLIDLGSFGALRIGQQIVKNIFQSSGYSIPEVLKKDKLGPSSDVFSVGVLLWELLAGKRLISSNPETYIQAVLKNNWKAEKILRADVPTMVLDLVEDMLALDSNQRPENLDVARKKLVDGLRRFAPGYGSNNLSELIVSRIKKPLNKQKTTQQILKARSAISDRFTQTKTFSQAGLVDRKISSPTQLSVGDRIPGTRYRLVKSLGSGGSAEVFCAQHIDLDRQVALKILNHELAQHSSAIAQFRLEARACSRLGHPHIVEVIDFGELNDGRFFFAMELVDGESLADLLSRQPQIPVERALPIFRQIARALQAAHDNLIIHRDIKPENIMLCDHDGKDDFSKILDFGVMAFTSDTETECVGTPGYMAPEQIAKDTPTPLIDIYALGSTLYESIAGRLPYPGIHLVEFATQQAAGPPPSLTKFKGLDHLHPAIENVILKAIEHDPAKRYQSAKEFEDALQDAQHQAGIVTPWDQYLDPPAKIPITSPEHREKNEHLDENIIPAEKIKKQKAAYIVTAIGIFAAIAFLYIFKQLQSNPKTLKKTQPLVKTSLSKKNDRLDRFVDAYAHLEKSAKAAAQDGLFTHPKGKSALDYILKIEALDASLHKKANVLRTHFSNKLLALSNDLRAKGYISSANTIAYESQLFLASTKTKSKKLAATETLKRPLAPNARQIAHLIISIEAAVLEKRLIKPRKNSALYYLHRLIKLDPKSKITARVQQKMAQSLAKQADQLWNTPNQENKAKELYAQILNLNPNHKRALERSAKKTVTVKKIKTRSETPQTTQADFAQSLRKAMQLLDQGKIDLAHSKLMRLRKQSPHHLKILLALAEINLKQGNDIKALEYSKTAAKQKKNSFKAWLLLGDANFRLGRKSQAQLAWQRALKLSPKHAGLKRRLASLQEVN